eukprot:TRINITY_DN1034_c0_g1_i2.p1 TRINITY_DN1034_c0_g1~~TRINITY_DN1034_c0_g1_i2.p1  ORF type:complete len:393 (-),score=97.19 TRINITY_DN1034_c0_g1_i2:81-1259(-)
MDEDLEYSRAARLAFHAECRRREKRHEQLEQDRLQRERQEAEMDELREAHQAELLEPGVSVSLRPTSSMATANVDDSDDDDLEARIPMPDNWVRACCWRVAVHPLFDSFIMAVILLNVVGVVLTILYPEGGIADWANLAEYLFTGVYVAEAGIKIAGFGWKEYWRSDWNKFDFLLVILSLVDMVVTLATAGGLLPFPSTTIRALRIVKVVLRSVRVIMRLVRLWHMAQVKAAADATGLRMTTTHVTTKSTIILNPIHDPNDPSANELPLKPDDNDDNENHEYRDKWTAARVQRKLAPNNRVCIFLALPGSSEPICPEEMEALFSWRTDDEQPEPVSFQAVALQPRSSQVQLKLEVLKTKHVGRVFTYYENGMLSVDRWTGHDQMVELGSESD